MALSKRRLVDIPPDAVMLSEDEAGRYQHKIMSTWKAQSDVFAYKHGGTFLAAMSALCGIYINNHYRMRFKLLHYGRMSSYLPVCVIPAFLSFGLHTQFVLGDILLQKDCPVCLEMRAAAFQTFMGSVFPTILAPVAAIPLAMHYNTYNVPYITKEPRKVFQMWLRQTKPIGNVLFGIFVAQAAAAALVTYFESKSVQTVHQKLAKLEYELETLHGS